MFSKILITLLPLAFAAPITTPNLSTRQLGSISSLIPVLPTTGTGSGAGQVVPTLPEIGIPEIRDQIIQRLDQAFGVNPADRSGRYGDLVNEILPFADIVQGVIQPENTRAIDVLADRLCIAGAGQGSLCNELFAYTHAWYVAQMNGWTYQFVAQSLGPNNMQQINDAIGALCIVPADDVSGLNTGLCQRISFAIDQNANALIGENTDQEDIGNSNSLEYFGLQGILPAPAPLGV